MTFKSIIVKSHWNNPAARKFGGFTKKENELILGTINWFYASNDNKKPKILNLFSGSSIIGDVRIDIDENSKATINEDCLNFLQRDKKKYDIIICDPPYNEKNTKKYLKEYPPFIPNYTGNTKNLSLLIKYMKEKVCTGGFLIFKHWFDLSPGKEFRLFFEVVTKYGGFRRITIMTCYEKVQQKLVIE